MNCPTCGKELRAVQVETMLGNPAFNEWCRHGYCSLACFEARKGDTEVKEAAARTESPMAAAPPSWPATPRQPYRKPFARTLATLCLLTFPFCWVFTIVGLTSGIHKIPRADYFYFVAMPLCIILAGFVSGVVALCLMRKYGREGILWKSVIGLAWIIAHVANEAWKVFGD